MNTESNPPLQRNVDRLKRGDDELILVGTAHVSKESVALVREIISTEAPDTVAVELCPSRHQSIRQADRWREMDIIKVVREKKAFLLLSNLILASFQRRIAQKMDVRPGEEMIAAVEMGETAGAEIVLADRDIGITLSRTWRAMRFWEKVKLLFQMLLSFGEIEKVDEQEVERLKQTDVLEAILLELEKDLPFLRKILIDERDRYIAEKIRTAPGNKIVAVVGAGHVPGIKKYLTQNTDLAELETVPPKKNTFRYITWAIPVVVCALFFFGFFMGGADRGTRMLTWWILLNGALAGTGALVALAHPFTVVSSVVAAPLTSLNPMIAAGWVSGLVEAFSRKPRVKDFESLAEDILSFKGFWKNKITRILLVVVFTNLGSSAGTLIALPIMIRVLG